MTLGKRVAFGVACSQFFWRQRLERVDSENGGYAFVVSPWGNAEPGGIDAVPADRAASGEIAQNRACIFNVDTLLCRDNGGRGASAAA